jgi:hypothetical protein
VTCEAGVLFREVMISAKALPTGFNKRPMVELFTGADCPPCIAADNAVEAEMLATPDLVGVIWHMSIPTFDEWSIKEFTGTAKDPEWKREQAYIPADCCFTPMTIVGGKLPGHTPVATNVDTMAGESTSIELKSASILFDGNKVRLKVIAHNITAASVNAKFNGVILEDGIANKPGYVTLDSGGITTFNEVARQYDIVAEAKSIAPGRNLFFYDLTLDGTWYEAGGTQEIKIAIWDQDRVQPGDPFDTSVIYQTDDYKTRATRQSDECHIELFE